MKKFLPVILLSFVFTLMVVSQMIINGKELSASRVNKYQEKHSLYEAEYSKLSLTTTKGTKIIPAKSEKPLVIVNFWASWCQPCVREFKSMNALLERYQDQVLVIGINNDTEDPEKEIRKIEDKYGLKFESVSDSKNSIASKFNVTKIPSTIIFYQGKVVESSEKEFNFMSDNFLKMVDDLLKK